MRIDWNKEDNTISVGSAVFRGYNNFKTRKSWVDSVLSMNNIVIPAYHPKQYNKAVADALGCSAPVLYKHFQALQYKVFVVPYKDLLMKIAFTRGRVNCGALRKIVAAYPLLAQAQQDGLTNILPIIMETGKSPQELKKALGNTWKVLAKNSLNRNKAIAKHVQNYHKENKILGITDVVSLPTTVIQTYCGSARGRGVEMMEHVAKHYKGTWSKTLDRTTQQVFIDTKGLATQLNCKYDHLWTPRRMKEEHDRMSKELLARRYSPEKLKILDNVPVKVLEHEGYVATLLDSAQLIAQEGEAMGHCVAGYADSVRRGDYLVYSITHGGERSSTLGVNVRKMVMDSTSDPDLNKSWTEYRYNQHYGKFNRHITDEHEVALVGRLMVEIQRPSEMPQAMAETMLQAA